MTCTRQPVIRRLSPSPSAGQSLLRPLSCLQLLAAGLALTACGAAGPGGAAAGVAGVKGAEVARQADGSYTITWTGPAAGRPVDVLLAPSPTAPASARIVVADNDTDGAVTIPAAAIPARARPYFLVKADGGAGAWSAERVLPLQGGRNFRDLGGYPAADGKVVAWGKLYRSGVMASLTATDNAYLKRLGINQICDFRSSEERAREPTNWQAMGVSDYTAREYADAASGDLGAVLRNPDATGAQVAALMTSLYGSMTERFAGHYTDMFQRLVEGKAPLAFNCSAGKDRTGIAAALVLTALGVPRNVILQDYALSDKIVDYEAAYRTNDPETAKGPYAFIAKLKPEVRAPLLRSDPAYLQAALAHLENTHGSVEAYLDKELGVDAADLARLRSLYLTDASQT